MIVYLAREYGEEACGLAAPAVHPSQSVSVVLVPIDGITAGDQ